jgi:hypothetical protein
MYCVRPIHTNDWIQAEVRGKVRAVSFVFVACGQISPASRNVIWRLMVTRQVKKLPTVCGTLRLRTVPTGTAAVPCGEPLESNCHGYKIIYKIYVNMTTAMPKCTGRKARCFVFRRCGVQTSARSRGLCLLCGHHQFFETNTGIITSKHPTAASFHILYKQVFYLSLFDVT